MRLVVGLILAGLAAAGGYAVWQVSIAADVGAAAIAKVVCSCVFVEGRTMESCRADDPPGAERATATVDEKERTVTGSVGGIISRRASYSEKFGCTLEP
jgi:hypothetical protein